MRVVLDTNVIIAAMRSPRCASAEVIRLAVRKRITPLGSLSLALEFALVRRRALEPRLPSRTPVR
jgi:predicted nucleic acid-binding protein